MSSLDDAPVSFVVPGPAPAPPRQILAGKYAIEREIDGGAMGRVFAATQLGLDRSVAVKVMREESDDFRERFLLEARSLASLNHRNIVSIIDSGETDDGLVFIVMEHLRGQTLAEALRRDGRMDVTRALHVATQVARGLRAAHRQGIVHRDLKPSNIFLVNDDDGEIVKLLDFGVAKALHPDGPRKSRPSVTREGVIVGTPTYMAPEMIGLHNIDERADLYSLGCLLYQAISGRPPFVGNSGAAALDVLSAHLHNEPEPLSVHAPWVPPGVDALVMRLLRKQREDRMPSADAVLDALKQQLTLLVDPFHPFTTDPSMDAIPLPRTSTPPVAFAPPAALAPPTLAAGVDITAVDLSAEIAFNAAQSRSTATMPWHEERRWQGLLAWARALPRAWLWASAAVAIVVVVIAALWP